MRCEEHKLKVLLGFNWLVRGIVLYPDLYKDAEKEITTFTCSFWTT